MTLRASMPDSRPDPGRPLFVVINAGSGGTAFEARRDTIARVFGEAGRRFELTAVEAGRDLPVIARQVVARAREQGAVVVAAGGDGTINAVAQAVLGSGCALGILPQGTFNYFGRSHGISTEIEPAAQALLRSVPHPVQVGLINDRVFLVNASLGLYPELLQDREAWKKRYGRSRGVALLAALATVLRGHRPLRLTLEAHGVRRQIRTPTLFVGNNPIQFERLGMPLADAVSEGQLAAVVLKPIGAPGLIWLALRGALGDLGDAPQLEGFGFERLEVRPSRLYRVQRVKVATDGEVVWVDVPLRFRVSSEPLLLMKPDGAPQAVPGSV